MGIPVTEALARPPGSRRVAAVGVSLPLGVYGVNDWDDLCAGHLEGFRSCRLRAVTMTPDRRCPRHRGGTGAAVRDPAGLKCTISDPEPGVIV